MIKTNVRINKKAVIFSVMVSLIYLFNFFHQVRYGAGVSDSYYHLSYVRALFSDGVLPKSQQSYPLFFYFIALLVLIFRNYTLAALLFVAIWAFASNYLQIEIINKLSHKDNGWYALLTGSALSFVWPISFHAFDWMSGETTYWWSMLNVYLTSGASAPYHNLTYLCAKPFALLTIYAFLSILDSNEDKVSIRFIVILAVSLLLSVLAKPCFYQCFAPAGTIFVVGYFIKGKCKELKKCLIIAATFVPATIWVLFSMTMKVQPIAFSPFEGIMMNNSDGTSVIVILGRAIAYVLFVGVCLVINKYKDSNMILGLLVYLFGVIEWTMLIFPLEKGALDMMWGYNMSVYLFFLFTIIAAKKMYDIRHNKLLFVVANVLFAAHALLGIIMFTQPWINAYKAYIFG
ncbi:hypothetical protein [Butyrivibrio hungatei]|uniref:Glycosyltransferase RgtA/B/C/D-like domain-containing protein n=1 Tax=Butyrivibrio hungatei TaxID=185008 RepID=A0A1D9NYY9_9FIRM|nr:hypothetical protein [Butyrivibrio hungatei]AOZ95510.1 hypothetical protein bhn_I0476 [Butyrivibrio hungatei]